MASFEGPASSGGELLGAASSPMTSSTPAPPEVPKLTPERAQQELARLTAIVKDNPSLHFLEPRVVKCMESGSQDTVTFLSFYRLISQSLSEELMQQKERLKTLETDVVKAKQSSAQDQMEVALAEASQVVNRVTGSDGARPADAGEAPRHSAEERTPQVDELLKKLEQAEVQRERLLQDMQNMRNRNKMDIEVRVFKAVEKFTQSLLPALDAFHQAMPSLKTATDTNSIVAGIEMIHDQLSHALIQAGLQKMVVVGTPFDPHLHEAIGEVETSDVPDDHIYDELQPGYMFGERMIRAAIVRLARNNGSATPAPSNQMAVPETSGEVPPSPEAPQAQAEAIQTETAATPSAPPPAPETSVAPSEASVVPSEASVAPAEAGQTPPEATPPVAPEPEAPEPEVENSQAEEETGGLEASVQAPERDEQTSS